MQTYTEDVRADALRQLKDCKNDFVKASKRCNISEAVLRYWSEGGGVDQLELALIAMGDDAYYRPVPPSLLFDLDHTDETFSPAPSVAAWMKKVFILDGAPLFNERHLHLTNAAIGVYWTNLTNNRQMKRVAGSAQIPFVQGGAWAKGLYEWHLRNDFGTKPDFIITLDATICLELPLPAFCALCEHELAHCAQAVDEHGTPKFTRDGDPKYAICDHDFAGFVFITEKYGYMNAEAGVAELIEAAKKPPLFSNEQIEIACGCGAMV